MSGPAPPRWEAEERHGYAGTLRTCGGHGGPFRGPIATLGGRGASRLRRDAANVRGAWGALSRPHCHAGRQRSVTATPGRCERAGGYGGPLRGPIATAGGRGGARLRRDGAYG